MKNLRLILSLKLPFPLLQKLCTIPEAANSEEVREFLALNTDATAAFQKKPSSSRIDKVTLSWDMTYCTFSVTFSVKFLYVFPICLYNMFPI